MPRATADETPSTLRPFTFHGVHFTSTERGWAQVETCPFCGNDETKFAVEVKEGRFKCFVCSGSGNFPIQFLQKLHEVGSFTEASIEALRDNRRLLDVDTIKAWGLVQSPITGHWLIPGYDTAGKMINLFSYAKFPQDKKAILRSTSEMHLGLFGVPLFDQKKETVFICETWNAPALWEVLKISKRDDDGGLKLTGNEAASLASEANVIGVPGANVWNLKWNPLLAGKRVVLITDNDHPRKVKGKEEVVPGAGITGARRTANILATHPEAPESIEYLEWGPDGVDLGTPSKYDIRDWLGTESTPAGRVAQLEQILSLVKPIPEDWIGGRDAATAAVGGTKLHPMICTKWTDLLPVWQEAMRWSSDLNDMLLTFLASILSTETRGEQIWILAMAPPSSGKTTLCEALAVSTEFVHCKSELNKVYSGYKNDKEGSEDFGIIPQINNKTLVVMEGNSILKDPNRDKILAQYRGLFDGVGHSHFNNGMSRDYTCRFTFILAGTAAMMEMDAAELGGRWVNCSFRHEQNEEQELAVCRSAFWGTVRNTKTLITASAESRFEDEMVLAKRMTGGFVNHLRRNAEALMAHVRIDPDLDAHVEQMVTAAGQFVAFLRARPPKLQEEIKEREYAVRLVKQFTRLAMCYAAVLGKGYIDDEVIGLVRRRAMDTARGRTLNLAKYLYEEGRVGAWVASLAFKMGEGEERLKTTLRFLSDIGVAEEHCEPAVNKYARPRPRWRLTDRVYKLYEEVAKDE